MKGWTTKVDSVGARLGSDTEFDGVTSCTSVESSGGIKVGLLGSENRATLDRYNVGADEQMPTTGVRPSMHGGDTSARTKQSQGANLHWWRARTECGDSERDCQTHRDPEVQEVRSVNEE
jgi:hypothetical protein